MNKKITTAVVLILFIANYFSWSFLFYLNSDDFRVTFLDVGQGDAILIKTSENHHILIDGGPGSVVLDKLKEHMPFFYNNIDLVVLSHAHYDHVSGLLEVVDVYDVENIICTGAHGEKEVSREWVEVLEEEGYIQARAGLKISGSDFYVDVLYPADDLSGKEVSDLNGASVISRLVFNGEYSFIFTGDAYAEQEERVVFYEEVCEQQGGVGCDAFVLDSDVVQVAHHGSKTSTSEEFLSAVSPDVGVIMVGEGNNYGHPHKEVLQILKKSGIDIKRTDQDGDIIFTLND